MPTQITREHLEDIDACSEHVALFDAAFPEGITVTPDNAEAVALAVVKAGLNVGWYADVGLTSEELAAYEEAVAPAGAAYNEAVEHAAARMYAIEAEARAVQRAAVTPARAAFDAVVHGPEPERTVARDAYKQAVKSAAAAFDAVTAPARAAFYAAEAEAGAVANRAYALALARILADRD